MSARALTPDPRCARQRGYGYETSACDQRKRSLRRMSEHDNVIAPQSHTPPLRFAMVEDHPHLYRGSYPLPKNLRFLERLRLKTIVSITPEPLGENVATWCNAQGVSMMHLKTKKQAKKEKHPIGYYETKQAIQVHFLMNVGSI